MGSCAASTLEALSRCFAADPTYTNVRAMMGLVDVVTAFGSQRVTQTLGHPEVLRRVEAYANNFPCPECRPWEFGVSRVYLATVLAMGADPGLDGAVASGRQVEGAQALLQLTRKVLVPLQGPKAVPGVSPRCYPSVLVEVLDMVRLTERMIARGHAHPWYRM